MAVLLLGALVIAAWAFWLPGDEPEVAADGTCDYTATDDADGVGLPPADPIAASSATITLDGEAVTVELLPNEARCTVGSLAHLAAQDYFDGTPCHRVTTSATLKVLQCGDPSGTGRGGPGYEFGLENVDDARYPAGTVAMARSAGDPESNGSQFFLVYDNSELPPDYTVFGKITDGLDVLTNIAERGTADGSDDGEPAEPVTLDDLVTGV